MFLFMRGKDTVMAQGTPIATYIGGNTGLGTPELHGSGLTGRKARDTTRGKKGRAANRKAATDTTSRNLAPA
jgi:hypothetical protein